MPNTNKSGVTEDHEIPLKLIRNAPHVVIPLLRDAVGFEPPEHTEVGMTSAECTDSKPRTYTADGAVLLRNGTEDVLAVVVERQREQDRTKFWTWPVYHATVRAQTKCPTVLLALCPTDTLARYYTGRISTGYPGDHFTPLVLGPSQVPVITDPQQAEALPELAVLSAQAHGDQDFHTVEAMIAGLKSIDPDRSSFYYDYVLADLGEAAKQHLEELMALDTSDLRSDFARRYAAQGREEGLEEGREALANSLLTILAQRQINVSDGARARIKACDNLETLETWIAKALTAKSTEELFQ